MPNPDRLSALDASFLELERGGAHMHVGSCLLFEGEAPSYETFRALLESRLHLVPRYRQKLAHVPLGQGRPVWVDDPHFNPGYHVRHAALPHPAGMHELRTLAGRVFSLRLDRSKPLWELLLVERVEGERFALIAKTHHALVDGISGVDIASVLFDRSPEPPPSEPVRPWIPRPEPSRAALGADALAERITEEPAALARAARDAARDPRAAAGEAAAVAGGVAALVAAGVVGGAPPSPLNQPIGHHRRFAWLERDLDEFRRLKSVLGGTVNDVVLTVVTGALRRWYRRHAHPTDGVTLKAMVPVSVRADAERGALGNRVATLYAPLPIYAEDPLERYRTVHQAMAGLKQSGQAVGAEAVTRLAGFAPPTVLAQAARLQGRQRFFNLTVTNVPGPQTPLYLCGRRLLSMHPMVPLAERVRLGIAVLSYAGRLDFGLVADYDGVPDLEVLAGDLRASIEELAEITGEGGRRNGHGPREGHDVGSAAP